MCPQEEKLKSEKKDTVVGANFDDERSVYKFVSIIEEPDRDDFEIDDEFIAYKRFAKEHNDSMGFDVEQLFAKRTEKFLTLKPVPLCDDSKIVFKECNKAVNTVLQYLDQKNEHNLVLVRIIKANYRSDFHFFVTFDAKHKISGEIKEYRSVIFRQLRHDKITLHMFKEIGAVKGAVKYDCRDNYSFLTIKGTNKEINKFKTKKQSNAYRKYVKEHHDSQGFDIKHFPEESDDLSPPTTLKHLPTSNKSLFEDCKTAVQNVLEYLKVESKIENDLALVRVVKANYRPSFQFFVTFEAKCSHYGIIKVYQSVISRNSTNGEIALHMFRLKGDAKGVVQSDCRMEGDFKSQAEFESYEIYGKEHDDSVYTVCESDTRRWVACETAIKGVLLYLRRKNEENLEFVRVIKANYTGTYQFYITFEAKIKGSENSEEYQAIIYRYYLEGDVSLCMFRKKGEPCLSNLDMEPEEVVYSFEDLREEYEFEEVRKFKQTKFDDPNVFHAYEKYSKEHKDSEGFDIETFVSTDIWGSTQMLEQVPPDSPLFEHSKEAVEIVLHNLSLTYEENLELVRVNGANFRSRFLFFVTFEAKNKASGEVNAYQSVIFLHDRDSVELHLFRKKQ